jgi:hypothetical protein
VHWAGDADELPSASDAKSWIASFSASCSPGRRRDPSSAYPEARPHGGPNAIDGLVTELSANQIVMGTDYLFPWTKTAVDHILDAPSRSDGEHAVILGVYFVPDEANYQSQEE